MTKPKKKIKWAAQCKLCKLLKTDKDLWREIHNRVIKEEYPKAQVCRWLNSQCDIRNLDREEKDRIGPFTEQNFSHHFKKHSQDYLNQTYMLTKQALSKGSRINKGVGLDEDEMSEVEQYVEDLNEGLTEYGSLSRMITSLERKLLSYDNYLLKKDQKNPDRAPNLVEIDNYRKQVASLMDLKIKLAALRNSATVAGSAVESSVEYSTASFLNIMMEVSEEAQNILITEMPGSSVPIEAIKLVRTQIAEKIKAIIPSIIAKIQQDFRIK
jgi:hypothetical protein